MWQYVLLCFEFQNVSRIWPLLISVLVSLGYCNKSILDWVLKQQTFISLSSGGWEVEGQSADNLVSGEDLPPGLQIVTFFLCVLTWQ